MLDALESHNISPKPKGHESNHVFATGQRIIYEGEEGWIIKLNPFVVVKTGSRIICGAVLQKIEHGASSL